MSWPVNIYWPSEKLQHWQWSVVWFWAPAVYVLKGPRARCWTLFCSGCCVFGAWSVILLMNSSHSVPSVRVNADFGLWVVQSIQQLIVSFACDRLLRPGCWPTHQKLASFIYQLGSPSPPTDAVNADHRVHGRKHHGKSRILRKEKTQATFNEFIWWVGTKWVFKHGFSRLICGGEQS